MQVRNLYFSYGDNKVLDGISFQVLKESITTVLGANGSGKTTLFHLMTKNLKPDRGEIILDGQNISHIRLKEFARKAAIVGQTNSFNGNITVEKLVSYGRTPFLSFMQRMGENDLKIIEEVMKITEITEYRNRSIMSLSGGQRQRVWIAMALAQDTEILFLDEPTTYLDIKYQIEVLELIRELNREHGITIIMVLHDINQAIHYSHEIIGLKDGRVIGQGDPVDIADSDFIREIYDIELKTVKSNNRTYVLQV